VDRSGLPEGLSAEYGAGSMDDTKPVGTVVLFLDCKRTGGTRTRPSGPRRSSPMLQEGRCLSLRVDIRGFGGLGSSCLIS
jgi:hypothetical protein